MNMDLLSMPSSIASSDPLFLEALFCRNEKKRPPIWLMRQAGRSLPEYRALKEKYSLEEMFAHPELIFSITKMPLDILQVDAMILFADILHVLRPLGFSVTYPKKGPLIIPPSQILPIQEVEESLSFVTEGIKLLKKELSAPLIGFCGGPLTVASYILEKEKHDRLKEVTRYLTKDPLAFHTLLRKITTVTKKYLAMQIEAGVDAIQIFDSWAGMLPKKEFITFCLPYLQELMQVTKKRNIPCILFCRNSSLLVEELTSLSPEGVSFDWHLPMQQIRKQVPKTIAVQGNLNPELLLTSFDKIKKKTLALLKQMENEKGFIVNLGHGVLPNTPVKNVKCLVDTVCSFSPSGSGRHGT